MEGSQTDVTGLDLMSNPHVSFLAQQVEASRKELHQQREILDGQRAVLERERISRDANEQSLKQTVDELKRVVQFESSARDSGYRDLSKQLANCFANIKDAEDRREASVVSLQSSIKLVAQSIADERKQRELASENSEKSLGTVQQRCESILGEAQETMGLCRIEVAQCRSSLEAYEADYRSGSANIQQELQQMQQIMALERSERMAAIVGLQAESAEALRSSVRELKDSLDALRLDLRNCRGEAEVRTTRIAEAMKDEAIVRASKIDEMFRMVDVLKHGIEQEKQERELLIVTQNRLGQDLLKRCDDEAQDREAGFGRLFQLVQDETELRQEELRKLAQHVTSIEEGAREVVAVKQRENRELAHAIEEARAALKSERAERMLRMEDLAEQVKQSKGLLVKEQEALAADREGFSRTAKKVEDLKETLDERLQELRSATDTTSSRIKEVGDQLSQTRIALSKDHELLTTEREERAMAVREWEGTKEEFQQRFKALADATSKLRDECKEAILREVRARTKHQTALEEAVKETVKETKGKVGDECYLQHAVESVKKEIQDTKLDFEKKIAEAMRAKPPSQLPSRSLSPPGPQERDARESARGRQQFTKSQPSTQASDIESSSGKPDQERQGNARDPSLDGESVSSRQGREPPGRRKFLPRPAFSLRESEADNPLEVFNKPRPRLSRQGSAQL